jgi:CRISPR system Cascade subunit CasE
MINKSGFSSVDFTGEQQITDMNKFMEALFPGIGRSKAFCR